MLGPEDHVVVIRDVLKKCEDIDFLLEERADLVVIGVAGDGQHGRMVELGVVEAVQQMDGTGPAGREADAEPPRELRVAARGECGRLLVATLDEPDLVAILAEGFEDAVDPVAGQSEGGIHTPSEKLLDDDVTRRLSHGASAFLLIPNRPSAAVDFITK